MPVQTKDATKKYEQYEAHVHDNELEILVSKECLCSFCGYVFSARDVKNWGKSADGLSARCPACGLCHVVGDASGLPIDEATGKALFEYRRDHVSKEAAREEVIDFCSNYYDDKIEDTEANERLYVDYLNWIYSNFEDAFACLNLARAYARGLRFVQEDVDKAIELYRSSLLSYDAQAQYELGLTYDRRNAKGDMRKAFECFSKSAALGSLSASLCIANYYMQGKYVAADQLFGANCMYSVYGELYGKAFSDPNSLPEFATCSYNLGLCFYHGLGMKKSKFRALRYFLIAAFTMNHLLETGGPELEWKADVEKVLDELCADLPKNSDSVVYDEDTFYDSFAEQQDSYADKNIVELETSEDGATLRLSLEFTRPNLVVDCGNAKVALIKHSDWSFAIRGYELHPTERHYERIEFVGENVANFIHEDPVYGDVVVLHIEFPPPPEPEEANEE